MREGVSRSLRLAHKWAAIAVAAPLLIVIATGIFLQVRKPVEWIQPAAERGSATFQPRVSQDQILQAVRSVPRMNVDGWDDLLVTDYRPRKGIIKVRTPGELETQIDATTGAVIKTGQRWNDIVMKIHDGSAFGGRLWLFLPAGMGALFLTVSGLYLGFVASAHRWRRQRHKRRRSDHSGTVQQKPLTLTQFCFKYHYWAALVVLIPWLIVITAGLVLQLRHEIPGVMPEYRQGVSSVPRLDYPQVLEVAKTIPELQIEGWSDIWRIYTYPAKGIMEIRTKIGYGAQLDAATGKILDVYARGSDFWEDLHEGIFGRHRLNGVKIFGDSKVNLSLWVFLPVNIVVLFLWFSGIVVAIRTTVKKAAPARIPAIAKQKPVPAAAMGGAASGTGIPLLPLLPPAEEASDFGDAAPSRQLRRAADTPGADQRRREARELTERRRAAARRTARRRADISEGGASIPMQAPTGRGTRQTRGRAAWRRRTS
jgi:uncharacterized iron-regulated membrane protein